MFLRAPIACGRKASYSVPEPVAAGANSKRKASCGGIWHRFGAGLRRRHRTAGGGASAHQPGKRSSLLPAKILSPRMATSGRAGSKGQKLVSGTALATVVGLLTEVPFMLILVQLCKATKGTFRRKL